MEDILRLPFFEPQADPGATLPHAELRDGASDSSAIKSNLPLNALLYRVLFG